MVFSSDLKALDFDINFILLRRSGALITQRARCFILVVFCVGMRKFMYLSKKKPIFFAIFLYFPTILIRRNHLDAKIRIRLLPLHLKG